MGPPPGGGAKPWIIMGILVVLIGGGLWLVMGTKKGKAPLRGNQEEVSKKVDKEKKKPRKAEETGERPSKKEMAELSAKSREDFQKNVGKWVRLQGEVRSGDEDGVLVFKNPAKVRGQLVKGSAEHLSGKIVKVIGWMVSEELVQIDGIFDITVVPAIDLLPKKDVYTTADAEQLVALRNTHATFKGKVESVRVSGEKKNLYIIFEGSGHQFYGSGKISTLEKDEVTEETLKELVGKTIKLKGKLEYKKMGEKERILINFTEKGAYEVVE
jgi:hypothetical protein